MHLYLSILRLLLLLFHLICSHERSWGSEIAPVERGIDGVREQPRVYDNTDAGGDD